MIFGYDWQQSYSSSERLAADLRLEFKGPGFYLTKTDTVLVLPEPPDGPASRENVWHINQPEGTQWRVFCWNCSFDQTIFAAALPPNRLDYR